VGLDFFECYQILGITGECEWQTIRKKYKSLIQQHHPDRFKENTPEHTDSQKSIREFNAAYKTLADYYALNQCLPPPEQTSASISMGSEKPVRKKRPPVSKQRATNKASRKHIKPVTRMIASILLVLVLIITINQNFNEASISTEQDINIETSQTNIINQTGTSIETPDTIQQPEEQPDLSYSLGASLGEVISIEGEPTSIEGSTWHYGKSSLTFSKGVVSGWHRHPDHPLKLRISSTPSMIHQPNHTEKKPGNVKKPYWQQ